MFDLRTLKKGRSRGVSVVHLVLSAMLLSLTIYTWKLSGCLGFPECYLCETFSPHDFLPLSVVKPPGDDFTRLINLKNFTFLMNNFVCNSSDLILLVLVHSDPSNFEKRWTIRHTWGRGANGKFKVLFLLGIPNSTVIQERLNDENAKCKDLVQGNFIDSYRNLTYKHVMALKWTKYFCPYVKYLLKIDDDVFVNSPSFLNYIDTNAAPLPKANLMRCLPVYEGRAQRSWRSKWRVTWTEYKHRTYPPYCQGFAILYSSDVAVTLYGLAQAAKYFWIDDVFITGILALSANYTPSTFGKLMLSHEDFHRLMRKDSHGFSYLLGPYNINVVDIKKLWEKAFKAG